MEQPKHPDGNAFAGPYLSSEEVWIIALEHRNVKKFLTDFRHQWTELLMRTIVFGRVVVRHN
jgi:hypothetical protein